MDQKEMLGLFIRLGKKAKKLIDNTENGRKRLTRNYFGDFSIRMDLEIENMVKKEIEGLGFGLITEERPEKLPKSRKGVFIMDPLDGSRNYARGFPAYAFAIAGTNCSNPTFQDIEVSFVMDLSNGDVYHSLKGKEAYFNGKKIVLKRNIKGTPLIAGDFGSSHKVASRVFPRLSSFAYMRMLGACIMDMALASRGVLDGYVDVRGKLLATHTAGIAIMRDSGMVVTDKAGKALNGRIGQDAVFTIIAARNREMHGKIMNMCK